MDDVAVHRGALLERIRRVDPRILVVVAPAGFGKTMLVRQYAAEREGAAFCDCSALRDDLDLARRVFPQLGALADGGATLADRLALALDAWDAPGSGSIVVFERAEQLAASPAALAFLTRLLERRPRERTVVLCSREPLRIHLTRYAAPHEILTLRAGDLIFSREDVAAVLAPFITDANAIDRVARISGGWPVAVFLLRRFACEGRVDRLLDRLDDLAFDELRDYFAEEVLAVLDPRMAKAIFASAAIPNARADDLRLALGDVAIDAELDELTRDGAFLERDESGAYAPHPMIGSLLFGNAQERREMLIARVARAHEERGNLQRAAELYVACGDRESAARALGAIPIELEPRDATRYLRVLAELDPAVVARYPRLWSASAAARFYRVEGNALLDESEAVWRTMPPDVPPAERWHLLGTRAVLLSLYGRFEEALAQIDEFSRAIGFNGTAREPLEGNLLYLRGLLLARRGDVEMAERDLKAALAAAQRRLILGNVYTALGAEVARTRGEWAVERLFLARGHDYAVSTLLPNFVAFNTAESLVAAWISGESAAFAALAAELETLVARNGIAGFAYLAGVARGREVTPEAADVPRFVIFGHLIALSRSRDEAERAALARAALRIAGQIASPFIEAIAAVAVALCDPNAFDDALARARTAAQRCESRPLLDSIEAIAAELESVGMLAHVVAQVMRDRSEAAPIALEVLAGRVRVDGAEVRLSAREFELLAAIAQRRDPTSRSRLAGMLWPDLDEAAARNALSVCLHRLRAHLGREDAIERAADGYRLHADAFVDCWEIERVAEMLRAREELRESERAALSRAWSHLRWERASVSDRWEWFAPIAHRLDEVRALVAHRLASDALRRGDAPAALAVAENLIADDPFDESASEIAVRAYLALGDRASALRIYRQYRDVLRDELNVEPSAAIVQLVNAV